MRVRDLRIDGFGRFANLELGPFDQPVTVFHGPNEAGKSTLLAFIRRVLFGFPDRRRRLNRYPPLAGGQHGGSMTIISDAGEVVVVRRLAGVHGGAVTLTAESGEPLIDQELPRLLGHHSTDVFQNVFSFTLDELHNDALLRDESVNSQIYSAGMGAAKLPGALKKLDGDKGRLFLKGGSKHAIHNVAQSLESVNSSLIEVAENAVKYGRLSARLEEVEAELERQNERRRDGQYQIDHQRQLQGAWDDWVELNTAEQGLAELPTIEDFPSDGINGLEKLEQRSRIARQELESARAHVEEAKPTAEESLEQEAIVERSGEIRGLERRRDYFDSAVRGLAEVEMELASSKNELTRTLDDLGTDWDESRLESFDLSIAVRQEVAEHQEQLTGKSMELERKSDALDRAEGGLDEAVEAEGNAQEKFEAASEPSLDDEQIRHRRNLIRAGRSQLGELTSARQHVGNLESQLETLAIPSMPLRQINSDKTTAAVGVAFAIALFVGGAALGGPALPFGIIAGLVAVGLVAYVFATNRSVPSADVESPLAAPIRESLRRAEDKKLKLETKLDKYAESLGMETIDENSLDSTDDLLDREQDQLQLWNRLSEDLANANRVTAQRTNRANQCMAAVEDAQKALDAARGQWRRWLAGRTLRETFSPDAVSELRDKVELGHTQHRDVRRTQRRIADIRKGVNDYVATVAPLASEFDIEFDRDNYPIAAAAADTLVELHAAMQEKVTKRNEAQANLTKAKRLLKQRDHNLQMAQDEMKRLLQSGSADDSEHFRKRADIHSQRRDLERKRSDAVGRLQKISGPGERLECLKDELRDTDIQAIRAGALQAEEDRKAVDEEIGELNTERGSIQNDLKNLIGEEESSRLRAERHRLLEEIRGHARKWAVRTIAENLLRQARSKFEMERQPDVVRHSTTFFSKITAGRYGTVFSPLGESEIHVTDSVGGPKQPNQLSRGTREQLFLSLRFGLIRELSQRSETLPVIVDEALVNFDPQRGIRAASAFMDLAQTNQVLVFTCHPQIVDWFVSAAAESGAQEPSVIEIEQATGLAHETFRTL